MNTSGMNSGNYINNYRKTFRVSKTQELSG